MMHFTLMAKRSDCDSHHWFDSGLFGECSQLQVQYSGVRLLCPGFINHYQTSSLSLTIGPGDLGEESVCIHYIR